MDSKTMKIVSLVLTLAGLAIGAAEKIMADKKMEATIAQKVTEAFAKGAGS